ncbi:MAG: hypothetical protein AAFO82_08460 [Bacteroidota bacterium]
MRRETIIAIILSSLVVIGLSVWIFTLSSKVKNLTNDRDKFSYDLSVCQTQSSELEDNVTNLEFELKEANLEIEYKDKEISRIEEESARKQEEINRLNVEKQELDKTIDKKEAEIRRIMLEGPQNEKVKEYVNRMKEEILGLKKEKARLVREKNDFVEQVNKLQKEKLENERKIRLLQENEIPRLKAEIESLQEEVNFVSTVKDYMNLRAEINNLRIDSDRNEILFNLTLKEEDMARLRQLGLKTVNFTPVIENISNGMFFIPKVKDVNNVNIFEKQMSDINNNINIVFPVSNVNLAKVYKKRNPINYDKGDKIRITVKLTELNSLSIADQVYRFKS